VAVAVPSADGVHRSTLSFAATASTNWVDTSWALGVRRHTALPTSSPSDHADDVSFPPSSTPDSTGLAGSMRRPTRAAAERRGPSPRPVSADYSLNYKSRCPFLQRDAMHSANYAVARCLSVCLFVCHTPVVCRKTSTCHQTVSPPSSHTILVCAVPDVMAVLRVATGTP